MNNAIIPSHPSVNHPHFILTKDDKAAKIYLWVHI